MSALLELLDRNGEFVALAACNDQFSPITLANFCRDFATEEAVMQAFNECLKQAIKRGIQVYCLCLVALYQPNLPCKLWFCHCLAPDKTWPDGQN